MGKQWRCFHCDAVFRSERQARIHFGIDQYQMPACKLSQAEGHLIDYIRRLEVDLELFRRESHEILLAAYSTEIAARSIERIAEERGYDKGVSEAYQQALKDFPPISPEQRKVIDAAVGYVNSGSWRDLHNLDEAVAALKAEGEKL